MIIFRYFLRELLATTFAVCIILLLILISGRLVKYLAEVAASAMDPGVMIAMLGYRIPAFLELTLPLAFFLALLLSLGRMHVENEITVLNACGFSEKKLFLYVIGIAAILAVFVGYLSLMVSPTGMAKYEVVVQAQKNRSEIDDVVAKKFYPLREDRGVIYADEVTSSETLNDLFLVMTNRSARSAQDKVVLIVAEQGTQHRTENLTEQYLLLNNGARVEGVPGSYHYQVTKFKDYGIRLVNNNKYTEDFEIEAIPTHDLIYSTDPKFQAALQWRLSLPIMMFVVAFLAWPLSRTKPRQGSYSKLLPAVIFYFSYLVGLNAMRGAIESGALPMTMTLMPLHIIFISIGLLLMSRRSSDSYDTKRIMLGGEK